MNSSLKWRLVIALVIVFFAGVAVGMMSAAHHARRIFIGRHSIQVGDRMHEHLRRELKLTAEQDKKVTPVLNEMSRRLETIREETSQRVAETMGESHRALTPLLTPEQNAKLEQMKRRHEHMLRWRGMHRGPPGSP